MIAAAAGGGQGPVQAMARGIVYAAASFDCNLCGSVLAVAASDPLTEAWLATRPPPSPSTFSATRPTGTPPGCIANSAQPSWLLDFPGPFSQTHSGLVGRSPKVEYLERIAWKKRPCVCYEHSPCSPLPSVSHPRRCYAPRGRHLLRRTCPWFPASRVLPARLLEVQLPLCRTILGAEGL